jgi:hypothetical protein
LLGIKRAVFSENYKTIASVLLSFNSKLNVIIPEFIQANTR